MSSNINPLQRQYGMTDLTERLSQTEIDELKETFFKIKEAPTILPVVDREKGYRDLSSYFKDLKRTKKVIKSLRKDPEKEETKRKVDGVIEKWKEDKVV